MAKGLQTFPLVAIKHPKTGTRAMIAEHTFDPKEHTLFDAEDKPAAKKEGDEGKGSAETDVSKMNMEQLKAYALQSGIDITGAKSKAEICKAIEAWKEANKVS